MTRKLEQEIEALQKRNSQLSSAILRISASLELGTVLQEVVDSARELTGARYAVIATIGETGRPQDFVASGFTEEERLQMSQWADGPRLFEHFRSLPGVLRLANLPAYVRSLGFSAKLMRSKTFQCTPMRHSGVQVGNFFLAEKAGGEPFSSADEEVLKLFASQAATAIANARTHREEQRARADLEALIETSPVGVVVFDAKTGQPVSLNRESKRIVDGLRTPGQSPEDLLDVVSFRREDGREITLSELPIAKSLVAAETIRAEEIELSVPDGRSVRVLLNATPIRSAQGDVVSAVITMQDLAPLEEQDRLRSEFLSMVSHELRTPLAAIKGSAAIWMGAGPAPDPAEAQRFCRVVDEQVDHMHRLISDLLDAGRIDAGMLSVSPVPAELPALVEQARDAFLSGGSAHAILIDLPRKLPPVLADGRRIVQVLNNLLANAARHSPGSAPIRVAAARDGQQVTVSVTDEGRGVPPEQLPQLFRRYAILGGADERPSLRRSGLGLSICKGLVEAHGGRIWAESGGAGQGARFSFTIPVAEEDGATAGSAPDRTAQTGPALRGLPILVVDDDVRMLRFLREALNEAGYAPIVTGDPRELPRLIRTENPRLVLLDLMLPGVDGIELLESVPELSDLPVIFISAYGRDETVARALERGAVDYLVKPFSATELTARIQAALRDRADPEPFVLGDLAVDYHRRRVTLAGSRLRLTASEYELLRILSVNAGRCVTYHSLIRQMWDRPDEGDSDGVRTFVKQLRRKLGDDPRQPAYIENERGVGYRMRRPRAGRERPVSELAS